MVVKFSSMGGVISDSISDCLRIFFLSWILDRINKQITEVLT